MLLLEENFMIFKGRFDFINGVLFIPGRKYKVQYVKYDTERQWYMIKISTNYNSVIIPYSSWEAFYNNWQQINQ